jgi:hypothetical protein
MRSFRSSTGSNDTADRDLNLVSQILELLDFRGETAYASGIFAAEKKTLCTKVGGFESVVRAVDGYLEGDGSEKLGRLGKHLVWFCGRHGFEGITS